MLQIIGFLMVCCLKSVRICNGQRRKQQMCSEQHIIPIVSAVQLQAWSGPDGSRKLRFPDFMTMARDDGKVVSLTHRLPLPTGNARGTDFV